jgi:predicted acyltransferase (DUF342 family)
MTGFCRSLILATLGVLVTASPAFASDDRVSMGHDITIAADSSANDLVCIFCSVRVHGEVQGDVVAILGSVTIDPQRSISGDVVSVGGDVSLGSQAEISGDLSVVGGDLNLGPDAVVHGDRSIESGRGWLLLPFVPLLFFIGFIWLIVYLVRRNRYVFPAYPQGRGVPIPRR